MNKLKEEYNDKLKSFQFYIETVKYNYIKYQFRFSILWYFLLFLNIIIPVLGIVDEIKHIHESIFYINIIAGPVLAYILAVLGKYRNRLYKSPYLSEFKNDYRSLKIMSEFHDDEFMLIRSIKTIDRKLERIKNFV